MASRGVPNHLPDPRAEVASSLERESTDTFRTRHWLRAGFDWICPPLEVMPCGKRGDKSAPEYLFNKRGANDGLCDTATHLRDAILASSAPENSSCSFVEPSSARPMAYAVTKLSGPPPRNSVSRGREAGTERKTGFGLSSRQREWRVVGLCTASDFPLRGVRSLVYLHTLLYPSLCNSLADGLRGNVKSMT